MKKSSLLIKNESILAQGSTPIISEVTKVTSVNTIYKSIANTTDTNNPQHQNLSTTPIKHSNHMHSGTEKSPQPMKKTTLSELIENIPQFYTRTITHNKTISLNPNILFKSRSPKNTPSSGFQFSTSFTNELSMISNKPKMFNGKELGTTNQNNPIKLNLMQNVDYLKHWNKVTHKKVSSPLAAHNPNSFSKIRAFSTPKQQKSISPNELNIKETKITKSNKTHIQRNIRNIQRKKFQGIKEVTKSPDYFSDIPHELQPMNYIEGCIDGFYGDWKRDEFNMTRSNSKIRIYNTLSRRKFYSKIYGKLPEEFLPHKKNQTITEGGGFLKFEEPELSELKKKPAADYKRISYIRSRKNTKLLEPEANILFLSKPSEKQLVQTEEPLQFPILDLGRRKYGGIKVPIKTIDKDLTKQTLMELNQRNASIIDVDINESSICNQPSAVLKSCFITSHNTNAEYGNDQKKFEQVLKYIGSHDSGILNPKNEDIDHIFAEYQKLNQVIYSHHNLDDLYGFAKGNQKIRSYPIIRNIEDKSYIMMDYEIDERMAKELGKVLQPKQNIRHIILVDNKMNDDAGAHLFGSLKESLEELEILRYAKNHIGDKLTQIFIEILFTESSPVSFKELTINLCKITSENFCILFDKASKYKYMIKHLGLAGLNLASDSITTLSKFLSDNDFIYSIDVSWNKLSRKNIMLFLKHVVENLNLRFLNLENNQIGSFEEDLFFFNPSIELEGFKHLVIQRKNTLENLKTESIPIIALLHSTFISHSSLMHINLSNTELALDEMEHLCQGIKMSVSLMAVHFHSELLTEASRARLSKVLNAKSHDIIADISDDNLKKVEIEEKESKSNTSPHAATWDKKSMVKRLIYYRIIDPQINTNNDSWNESNSCWICERWNKINIKYKIESIGIKAEPDSEKSIVTVDKNSLLDIGKRLTIPKLNLDLRVNICGLSSYLTIQKIDYDDKFGTLDYYSYLPPGKHKYQIQKILHTNRNIITLIDNVLIVKPRETEIKLCQLKVPDNDLVRHKKFHFLKSVFRDFREETEFLYDRCLESDWNSIKVEKIIKKSEDITFIHKHIRNNYKKIKSIFLYNISKSLSYPTMSWEHFLLFGKEIDLFDDSLRKYQVEKAFLATNVQLNHDRYHSNPDRELCRYEFIEILIRLALHKYYDTKICQSAADSWEYFYNTNVLKAISNEEYEDAYRKSIIHTIHIDEVIKKNYTSCMKLFNMYRTKIFGLKFQTVKELLTLSGFQISNEDFIYIAAYSKITFIDELKEGKDHLCFSLVEFLEFTVRLADFLFKDQTNKPLYQKLEQVLQELFKIIGEEIQKLDIIADGLDQ